MIQNQFNDVYDFHKKFDCSIGEKPAVPPAEIELLALRLVNEEFKELSDALAARDLPEIADAIADLIYVLNGMAIRYGIYLPDVWAEVHRTNMAKIGGGADAGGKIKKPAGWTPPDIAAILRYQWSIQQEISVADVVS